MLTRGGPCARGRSFDSAWWCDGPWGTLTRRQEVGAEHFILLGPIMFGGPLCRSTRLVQLRKGRPRKGQDRREGPYHLSKIHGRLSEKDAGPSGPPPALTHAAYAF